MDRVNEWSQEDPTGSRRRQAATGDENTKKAEDRTKA